MAPTPYERPRSVRNATASNDFKAALTAGAQSYQTKPVHLPTLLQLIDELLRQ